MRIELNLASRPTENRRRYVVLTATAMVVLLALAVFQGAMYWRRWGSGRQTEHRVVEMQAEIKRLDDEQKQLEASLQRPEAVQVFDASYFLNGLIRQKSFSWTQLFMDLEKLVPYGVEISSIHPDVQENNRIDLSMMVAGKTTDDLLEFVRRLEGSDKFGIPTLRTETPPESTTAAAPGVARLSLTVIYVQK